MRADVMLSEDTTTLFVRWALVVEMGEAERLARRTGSLVLRVETSSYVDEGGRFHEHLEVDVPIHPHAGRVSRGQAKFRDPEARRRFVENLQDGVSADVAAVLWADEPEALDVAEVDVDVDAAGSAVIRRAEWAPAG